MFGETNGNVKCFYIKKLSVYFNKQKLSFVKHLEALHEKYSIAAGDDLKLKEDIRCIKETYFVTV